MRPLRLFLSLATSLLGITLLLYVVFGSSDPQVHQRSQKPVTEGRLKASWSFTSPGSLFPPSAIISLTDDNSTFFLARPAAFGPPLPKNGLSGPIWIGSGFGDGEDTLGRGELGCSDVPGWSDDSSLFGMKQGSLFTSVPVYSEANMLHDGEKVHNTRLQDSPSDGTDDSQQPPAQTRHTTPEHADIRLIQESAEITGKVALLKRGGCAFSEKALWAQRRGATALIVGDDVRGGPLIRMYASGDASNISIPSVFTSYTTAHLLSSLLPPGGSLGSLSPGHSPAAKISGTRPPSDIGGEPIKTAKKTGWLQSLPHAFSSGHSSTLPKEGEKSSGSDHVDWTSVDRFDAEGPGQSRAASGPVATPTPATHSLTVDKQKDWREPGRFAHDAAAESVDGRQTKSPEKTRKNWFSSSPADYDNKDVPTPEINTDAVPLPAQASSSPISHETDTESNKTHHDGLWVTIELTNMSASPLFDTLLVLVVSPLVTLTVVYTLLLIRARLHRRRWRAPKSVVERLPVRTYQTISDSPPPTATPITSPASSPTAATPLLQTQARAALQIPQSSSPFSGGRTPEEKRDAGLAEWRRRYGGRQRECVVCLDEYEDGVSQVMSLPCGHEFHADCITPWLVTRRRTCPICKGDVVASLSQSYRDRVDYTPSSIRSPRLFPEIPRSVPTPAAETPNNSLPASRQMPISSSSSDLYDDYDNDLEANWEEDETGDQDNGARDIPQDPSFDISSSVRGLSSTVQTTIWRGVEAIRDVSGLQQQRSENRLEERLEEQSDVDR